MTGAYAAPNLVAEAVLAHLAQHSPLNPLSLRLAKPPRLLYKPWSTLYFLTAQASGQCHDLVAKIVHFPDQTTAEVSWQSQELLIRGRREFETMQQVFNHFAQQPNPLLSAVYPRAYLPQFNAVVMDFAAGTPLYDRSLAVGQWLAGSQQRQAEHWMQLAGQWLRWFHRLPLDQAPSERCFTPADTFQSLIKTIESLRALGVNPTIWPGWSQTLATLAQIKPHQQVWCHGDFHLRNVLVTPNGGVLSFDTALERIDSPYFDLGKFVADMKTRRAMILRLGLLPPPGFVERLRRAFLSGYLAGESLAPLPLALYEGFFIFEKWVESLTVLNNTFSGVSAPLGAGFRHLVVNSTFRRIAKQWMQTVKVAAGKGGVS
ncbi:MAG: aminoglycoside phosphotransferase family protein [Chloroflexi bacterium]|nr:aminoglycoside phosphotransferase family protein [Chloroflexota bacterium]